MEFTINEIYNDMIKSSDSVFGVDEQKLTERTLSDKDTNNAVFRFIKKMDKDCCLPLEKIKNYDRMINVNGLTLKSHTYYDEIAERSCTDYGLFIEETDILLNDFFDLYVDLPEYECFLNMIYTLTLNFYTYGLYQTSLMGYMLLLAENKLTYLENVFRGFYLADYSETPDFSEAIKHFSLTVNNGNVRFVLKDRNCTLDKVYSELITKRKFIDSLRKRFSSETIKIINEDILSILSVL